MTKYIITLALALSLLSADAQTRNSMNDSKLTARQLHLAICAALEAQGDMARLDTALRKALDEGVTVNELKEAFSQLYAYTGFPRSLNALNLLKSVLDERKESGINDNEGKPWQRPTIWDDAEASLKRGTEVQTRLCGGVPYHFDFSPQDDHYLKAHLFGDIFAGDQLSEADREIVTVAALSAMKGVERQLASHKRGAVMMGNRRTSERRAELAPAIPSEEEEGEANTAEQVEQLCSYLSENGLSLSDHAAEACHGDWPKGNPNTRYARYFTGNSHLASITPKNLSADEKTIQGYSNVTFEPGCRNNWHIHHGVHQILICVSGKGWYQEWGKPAIPLKAGDIIDIPEGVKHWHGAQQDSRFQHLATHVKTNDEEKNEWLESVSDEEYNKLK